MIIWGGVDNPGKEDPFSAEGAAYNPSTQRWRVIAEAPLLARWGHSAVWTGEEMIVWGGSLDRLGKAGGAAYDPIADTWRMIADSGLRWERRSHTAVWTGKEMIIWGARPSDAKEEPVGLAYDPPSDTWRPIPEAPIADRAGHTAIWTGEEMIIWGGGRGEPIYSDGAAYDPVTDTWRLLPPSPLAPRGEHSAVWTGKEMIVWGGSAPLDVRLFTHFSDGAAYDPATNSWRLIAEAPISARRGHTAVWMGNQMIVWGGTRHISGSDSVKPLADGAAYDPATDQWVRLPESPLPPSLGYTAVWTGEQVLIWGVLVGDYDLLRNVGAAYKPASAAALSAMA
ncbi:MAG: hypothetical protein HYZ68_03550 [Chloroflexi bacterium]|nr:hypothetical protein [Chloroflexota bacterium]